MQGGARQADRAQHLAAQLRQAGEDVLDAGAWRGDAFVAPLLGLGQRFVFAALALDMPAPAGSFQSRFTLAVDVAFIGVDVAAGVGRIDHLLEVQCVVFAGGADLDFANKLVALIGTGRELVAEVGLTVFLGPACLDILLAPLCR